MKRTPVEAAFYKAVGSLARSSKTEKQVRDKLREWEYSEDIIEEVIIKLKDYEYLNDERYVDAWIRSNINKKGMNKKIIFNKLVQKGVDRCLINKKIEENNIDECKSAEAAAIKKYSSLKGDKKIKRNKLYAYLYQKGFNTEVCQKIIDKIMQIDE